MYKNVKGNRGITLIVLVITVITMIIIAGVTINTVLGRNALIDQAQKTKIKATKVELEEDLGTKYINFLMSTGKDSISDFCTFLIENYSDVYWIEEPYIAMIPSDVNKNSATGFKVEVKNEAISIDIEDTVVLSAVGIIIDN